MPKISAAEFIQAHQKRGRSSKLEPYREDILLLKSHGYTQQQILDFLKMNGITVGMTTLNWFIRSRTETDEKKSVRQNQKIPSQASSEKSEITESVLTKNQQEEVQKTQLDVAQQTVKISGNVKPTNEANSESPETPPGEPRKFKFKPSEVDAKNLM
ncbi:MULTISPECIES: hypothetical protein [unclassified Neisseria]|uniref:hypothetical protein n=1 Tax=unclassified Neisseria TaxID=2623750 RepID=UPI00266521D3|nr:MULTISPECIES: hypothetical protein [unclassified Neisseria]MDO1509509.1 hypothetical protein [Neisseria sp. MVDL19-042950]MDO1515719.1 hypothetical protein [Neisseria sp. MVDL18-041461]MDO1563457.1 hypothetical protein [Neisseria sp. MVDL20-010259]